jgi:acyl-CoA thioesterase
MNRYRWWHRLRGHQIGVVHPDFKDPHQMASLEYTKVRHRCTCGDEWIFYAMGMYETYQPGPR